MLWFEALKTLEADRTRYLYYFWNLDFMALVCCGAITENREMTKNNWDLELEAVWIKVVNEEQFTRRLQKYKGAPFILFWKILTLKNIEKHNSTQSKIKPLTQPKGEAGNHKRGFILYSAMGMEDVENGAVVYDRMRVRDCFFANVFLTRLSGFGS